MTLQEMQDTFDAKVAEISRIADQGSEVSHAEYERAKTLHEEAKDLKVKIAKAEERKAYSDKFQELSKNVPLDSSGRVLPYGAKRSGAPSLDFSEHDLRQLYTKTQNRESVSIKATAIDSSDVPQALVPQQISTPFGYLRESTRILDHIPVEMTDRPAVTYYSLTSPADSAASVSEGGAKPESNPVFTPNTATVVKLAHTASLTDEVAADFGGFLSFLGEEMLSGLINEENRQLLTADGSASATGVDMVGLVETAGVIPRPLGSDTQLDAIAGAINDLRVGASYIEPDVIVMHPSDALSIRITKDLQDRYLAADPLANQRPVIFGVPLVVTTQMTEGTVLVGNLKAAAKVYVRESPRIETSRGGYEEFVHNISLIRAEERLALAVVRPSALCVISDFSGAS